MLKLSDHLLTLSGEPFIDQQGNKKTIKDAILECLLSARTPDPALKLSRYEAAKSLTVADLQLKDIDKEYKRIIIEAAGQYFDTHPFGALVDDLDGVE